MLKRLFAITVSAIFVFSPLTTMGATISRTYTVDSSTLRIAVEEETRISVDGLIKGYFQPGEPNLPSMPLVLPLSAGTRVAGVSVVPLETRVVSLPSLPEPVQVASAWKQGPRVDLKSSLRQSSRWFPESLEGIAYTGHMRGRPLASIVVTPVQWSALDNTLLITTRFRVDIEIEDEPGQPLRILRESQEGADSFARVYSHVTGAKQHGVTRTAVNSAEPFNPTFRPTVDGSAVEMVIITSADQVSEYQRLADFKNQTGLTTVVRSIDWIRANYAHGSDLQETIRHFIRDAVQNWGTAFVLLGGDTEIIPERYGFTKYYGSESIPTDLYYTDLDGTWNDDGDGIFGEGYFDGTDPGDSVDMYPDVWVGRLPSNNATEAQILVDKNLAYQKTPVTDGYLNDFLLLGEVLFPQHYSPGDNIILDGADYCQDLIDSSLVQHNSIRLYENFTAWPGSLPEDYASVIAQVNTGRHLIHHVGHGYINTMSVGIDGDTIGNSDAEAFTNGAKGSILYAINCTSCAVDYNSISESWLRNPNGGATFVIGSTRWDFPTTGSLYQDEFYGCLFHEGVTRLGETMAVSKIAFVPSASSDNSHRWTQFTQIALGDPSLDFWTDNPFYFSVTHASTFQRNAGTFPVDVMNGGSPVQGALITLFKENDAYGSGTTDAAGHADVPFNPDTDGTFTVGVSMHDAVPYIAQATVTAPSTPFLYASSQQIDDDNVGASSGNTDSKFDAGETVELGLQLTNSGGATETAISATLSTSDPYVTIVDPTALYNAINASSSAYPYDGFVVDIDPTTPDRHQATCSLVITGTTGTYSQDIHLYTHSPLFEYRQQTVRDSVGNGDGNGIIAANEDFAIIPVVRNLGLGTSSGLELRLRSTDPAVTVTDSIVVLGDVPSGSIASISSDGFAARFSDVLTVHQMQVVAIDGLGERLSLPIDVSPPDTVIDPVTQADATSITITWEGVSDTDLWGYNIYRGPSISGPFTRVNDFTTNKMAYFKDEQLPGLTRFYYQIASVDLSGNEGVFSAVVTGTTTLTQATGWPVEVSTASTGGITLADLDADGVVEILGAGEEIYALHTDGTEFNDGDNEVRTLGPISETQKALFWNTPAAGDIDRDGRVEVAGIGWNDAQLWLMEADGTMEPGWPKDANPGEHASPNPLGSVCFADCDGDGDLEVLAIVANLILAWNPDGTEIIDGDGNPATDGVLAVTGSAYSYATPTVADIDGDSYKEIVAGMRDGYLYVYDRFGATYPGFPMNLGGNITGSPSVGDVGSDGTLEMVVPSSNNLINAIRADGSQSPGFPVVVNFSADVDATPALGDFDGDGKVDVAISAGNGLFFAIDGTTGFSFPGFPVPITNTLGKPVEVRGSPVMADVNGDGSKDVVFGDYNGLLHGYDNTGQPLDGFPIQTGNLFENSPAVWDIDGDGLTEIIAESFDQNIYVWDTPWTFDITQAVWPMFKRNQGNSGELGAGVFATTGVGDAPVSKIVLHQNYPNPVVRGSTKIRYRVPEGDDFQRVELDVFDLQGRLVRSLIRGEQFAGEHEVEWNGTNSSGRPVASGMYAYRLIVGDQTVSRKMLVAR